MKTRIFISKPDAGWIEVDIPAEFSQYNYERLVRMAHRFVKYNDYKGLLITQNPTPFEH